MQKFTTIILGATVFGIAVAITKPDSTIIIEKSMLLGSEFISSMNIKVCNIECQTEAALNFREDMKKHGLLNNNGEVHVFPVSGLLSSYIRKAGVNILLMTEVVSIKTQPGGFLLTIYNSDGFSELFAEKIIDTTSEGILHRSSESVQYQKSICAMLLDCRSCDNGGGSIGNSIIEDSSFKGSNIRRDILEGSNIEGGNTVSSYIGSGNIGSNNIEDYDDGEAIVLKGKFDGEYALKVRLDKNADWPTAREVLHSYWQKHMKTAYKGWKIASVASAFAYDFAEKVEIAVRTEEIETDEFRTEKLRTDETVKTFKTGSCIQNTWLWIPSASYSNILSAYEGGVLCAAQL